MPIDTFLLAGNPIISLGQLVDFDLVFKADCAVAEFVSGPTW